MRPGRRGRGSQGALNAWPGYVDALSTLLMVVTFVLLVFVLGQAFMSVTLNKREHMLETLQAQISALSRQLATEQGLTRDLRANMAVLTDQHNKDTAAAAALGQKLAEAQAAVTEKTTEASSAGEKLASLTAQMDELNSRLGAVSAALTEAQASLTDKDKKVSDLDQQLQTARNGPLARWRSAFFSSLTTALKDHSGVRIVGDHFVFQSEVLFPVGSADLTPRGITEIRTLAKTLHQVTAQIPADVPWLLRVDGHADRQPIHTAFPSNWELSAARAITVVKLLIAEGADPKHLAATAFADYQPLSSGQTAADFARNRRIEFRLTDR